MRKHFLLLLIVATLIGADTFAQSTCPPPDQDDIDNWAMNVEYENKYYDSAAHQQRFWFERDMRSIACVKPADKPDVAKKKVQAMWQKYRTKLSFSASPGKSQHILKFAVDNSTMEFLKAVILRYELDVDFVDPDDGKTLKQYVEDQQAKAVSAHDAGKQAKMKEILGYIETVNKKKTATKK